MKSAINNISQLEEDANLSKFRRRNNILILVFATFFISLIIIIAALIFNLVRHVDSESGQLIRLNPAVRAFYHAASCHTASCREAFNPIISRTHYAITDPNQIFILSLQTAADQLQNITVSDKNCSDSLRFGSGQIRGVLATVRGNPFVEKRTNEQRVAIMNRIALAEEDLKSCVGDLGKVESTAVTVSDMRWKVFWVMVYVRSAKEFAVAYDESLNGLYSDVAADDWRNMISDNMFIIFMCGLQLLFIFFLYWTLFRFG